MILRLSFIALLCLAITQWAAAQFTDISQSARRDAHRQLQQAITAWQHNDLVAARRLVDAALATGVPDEQFAISPKHLLRRIELEQARLERAAEAARQEAAELSPPNATEIAPSMQGLAPLPPTEEISLEPKLDPKTEPSVEPVPINNEQLQNTLAPADFPRVGSTEADVRGPTADETSAQPMDLSPVATSDASLALEHEVAGASALLSRLPGIDESKRRRSPLDWLATRTWKVGEDRETPEKLPSGLGEEAGNAAPPTMSAGNLDVASIPPPLKTEVMPDVIASNDADATSLEGTNGPEPLAAVPDPLLGGGDSQTLGDDSPPTSEVPGDLATSQPWMTEGDETNEPPPQVVAVPVVSPERANPPATLMPVEPVPPFDSELNESAPIASVRVPPVDHPQLPPATDAIGSTRSTQTPQTMKTPTAPLLPSQFTSEPSFDLSSSTIPSTPLASPTPLDSTTPRDEPSFTIPATPLATPATAPDWKPAASAPTVSYPSTLPQSLPTLSAPASETQDMTATPSSHVAPPYPTIPQGSTLPSAPDMAVAAPVPPPTFSPPYPIVGPELMAQPASPDLNSGISPVNNVQSTNSVGAPIAPWSPQPSQAVQPPPMVAYGANGAQPYPMAAPVDRRAFGRPGTTPSQRLVVGPATGLVRHGDNLQTVMPNVRSRPIEGGGYVGQDTRFDLAGLTQGVGDVVTGQDMPFEVLPDAGAYPHNEVIIEGEEPIFGSVLQEVAPPLIKPCSKLGRFLRLFHSEPCPDRGVGYERLASAPMFIDIAQPLPNTFRIRLDAAHDVQAPDRAEFIYSSLVGMADYVNYQDVRLQMELGSRKLSTATEIPIRVLDPLTGANTAGLGDMSISVKTVLLEGETWQITQLFRTRLNTGAVTHNLSVGHVAMEPGVLFRMKWDEETVWHGQLKYRFPIGGNPMHSGQVMQVGSAISKLWYETDQVALIPSMEAISYFVLDGQQYSPGGAPVPVDGEMILNLAPSLRFVVENGSDLGLLEFGLGSSFAVTSTRWHSFLVAGELRITF